MDGEFWRITLRPPTGGLYRIESRLFDPVNRGALGGDNIWHLAVGDLWVIAGQSNAVGYGHGVVADPPALGVSAFGGNEVWRLATHPIFDSTDTKHPANRDGGWIDVSPWLAFGKEILQHTGVPVGLIPTALGGSPLSAWDPGNPDGAYLYDNMVDIIEAAGGRIAGMVWYQGCSDAFAEDTAQSYLPRFTRFVESFRAKYGADLPVITAQLNRYYDYATITPELDRCWAIVREAQRQAAKVVANLAVVPTLDLSLSDVIHTSAVGNVILGQRFGLAARGMVYGQDMAWQPMDVCRAAFTDGDRKSIRLSCDCADQGVMLLTAQPGDFTIEDTKGTIPVTTAACTGTGGLVLELERQAEGKTVCHNMFGCDPVCTVRDQLLWPLLAFHNVEVSDRG